MLYSPDFINDSHVLGTPINVVVVGAGGTGSIYLSKLFQMHNSLVGLGHSGLKVTVIDPDIVTASNVGRQAFYEFDIGFNKAQVLVNRFNQFANTNWQYSDEKFTKKSQYNLSNTVIIGCVDNVEARKAIHHHFKQNNCVFIDTGNDKSSGQVVCGVNAKVENKPYYIPSSVDLFAEQIENIVEVPSDSCSHEESLIKQDLGVNDQVAAAALQIFWRMVRHGKVNYHGIMLDLEMGCQNPIRVDPDEWAMFGYKGAD